MTTPEVHWPQGLRPRLLLRRYDGSHCTARTSIGLDENTGTFRAPAQWEIETRVESLSLGVIEVTIRARSEMAVDNVSLGLDFQIDPWSVEDYLVFPGVVYAGNRFACRPMKYPPIAQQPDAIGAHAGPFITDVLRLNDGEGTSGFHLLAGAMAFPTIGILFPQTSRGWAISTAPFANDRETGFAFQENEARTEATLSIMTPGVREGWRYTMCTTQTPSQDRGADLPAGGSLELKVRLVDFACETIPALFEKLLVERAALTPPLVRVEGLPFSAAWDILERKYNRENWSESDTHYGVGKMDNRFEDFQTGWIGGLMNTLPLAHEGAAQTRQRAHQTLDFFFNQGGPAPSGFFHGCYHAGVWSGDGFDLDQWTPQARPHPDRNHYHLLRKSADALYFLGKHYDLFARQDAGWKLPPKWEAGTRGCADAFVRLWRREGQLGQFVDINTGQIIMGGTSSPGIAPAGLMLAARIFNQPEYAEVAREIADFYHRNHTSRGLTNGGPGEILQCPDSESSAGLLESYIVLWEETQEPRWLAAAEQAAQQAATWQMSYDYAFPSNSEFGRLDIKSTGSVIANTQNGHSAPAICTLSGNSYFKLWRATGKAIYLQLLDELAHNLTQYLSRADQPILTQEGKALPEGWINERVNTGDWDDNLGGVFYGTTWAEVSLMLTVMEVPGVYVDPASGFVHAFDHVQASLSEDRKGLQLHNPTAFPARTKILVEKDASSPLKANYLWAAPVVDLAPGTSATFRF